MEGEVPPSFPTIARAHGITPSKALGQHFLINPRILRRIVELADITGEDVVVEVGPGLGSLTWYLARTARLTYAIELDARMLPVLEEALAGDGRVRVIQADALVVDESLFDEGKPRILVSNLPYNIATTLVIDYLVRFPFIERYVVTVQAEVAERLKATAGDRSYGAVSVKAQSLASVSTGMRIAPKSFFPPPAVDSAVVSLTRRPMVDADDIGGLFAFVDAAFAYRRKTLINSLVTAGSPARLIDAAKSWMKQRDVPMGIRAERLSSDEFISLLHALQGTWPQRAI